MECSRKSLLSILFLLLVTSLPLTARAKEEGRADPQQSNLISIGRSDIIPWIAEVKQGEALTWMNSSSVSAQVVFDPHRGQQSVLPSQQRTQHEQHWTGQPGGLPSAAAQPAYSTLLQKGLGEGRPQVLEVPRPQGALPAAPPPQAETHQSRREVGPQRETRAPGQTVSFPPPPVTIGLVAQSVRFCRAGKDIAGVKVAGLENGSPAQQAGLQAENEMGWKQIVAVLLTFTPAAPLVLPLLDDGEQESGDIIVAVDGQPVKDKEAFAREMARFQAGHAAYLSVLRGEKTLVVPVHLPSRPESAGAY